MNTRGKAVLTMIVSVSILLTLAIGVHGGLVILGDEQLVQTRQALLSEYVDSIIDWETVVSEVPSLAGYEVDEYVSIRGKKECYVIITPDSPILWTSSRWVSRRDPYRSFGISVDAYDSLSAFREATRLVSRVGYEVQEGKVTTGFHEEDYLEHDGTERTVIRAFAARHRITVSFTVRTEHGAGPLVQRAEIEKLVELVKERLSSGRVTLQR